MYVSSTAPLPPNSLDAPSAASVNRRRRNVDRLNAAAALARLAVECPPDPWAYQSLGDNLALDVAQANAQASASWNNPQVSGMPLAPDTIPGNAMADPPVNSPGVVVMPLNAARIREAQRRAPEAITLNYSTPQVSGCEIVIPTPIDRPRPQLVAKIIMPAPVPPLPSGPAPATPGAANLPALNSSPAGFSPCPPGAPFQGRYVGGAPVCGAIGPGGFVRGGPGFARGYASIVGMGDAPPWGDASLAQTRPGASSAASSPLPPWVKWLTIGAGLFALARKQ